MQPLYTDEEFKAARFDDKLPLQCLQCDGTFFKMKCDILTEKSPPPQGTTQLVFQWMSAAMG